MQFLEVEGLGNIVVSTGLQACNDVFLSVFDGEHDDIGGWGTGRSANLPANHYAVHSRHQPVKDNQLRSIFRLKQLPCLATIAGNPTWYPHLTRAASKTRREIGSSSAIKIVILHPPNLRTTCAVWVARSPLPAFCAFLKPGSCHREIFSPWLRRGYYSAFPSVASTGLRRCTSSSSTLYASWARVISPSRPIISNLDAASETDLATRLAAEPLRV